MLLAGTTAPCAIIFVSSQLDSVPFCLQLKSALNKHLGVPDERVKINIECVCMRNLMSI